MTWPLNKKSYHSEDETTINKVRHQSKCLIYDSKMRWAKHCLHRIIKDSANNAEVSESECEDTENVQITLITEKFEVNNVFLADMSCSAAIYTACSEAVARIDWLIIFTKNLYEYLLNQVLYKKWNTPLKFGDARKVYSQNKAKIPAKIGKTPCNIEINIVDAKIPLLLSKSSLKKANTLINLQNHKVTMFDKDIDNKL